MSAIRRRNVKNRWFDWQTEFLPTVNPNNAQLEGFVLSNVRRRRRSAIPTSLRFPSATPPCRARRRSPTLPARGAKWPTRWRWPPRCSSQTWRSRSAPVRRASMKLPASRRSHHRGASHWLGRAGQGRRARCRRDRAGHLGRLSAGTAGRRLRRADRGAPTEAMLGDAMQKAYTNGASPTLWVIPPGPKRTVNIRWSIDHSGSGWQDRSRKHGRCVCHRFR